MTKVIVNLMTAEIERKLEDTLSTYADHPYQQAFSIPELRQELIAYVLSRIPGHYVVVEDNQAVSGSNLQTAISAPAMQEWIQAGIQSILDRHAETLTHHLPETDESGRAPSHWFG